MYEREGVVVDFMFGLPLVKINLHWDPTHTHDIDVPVPVPVEIDNLVHDSRIQDTSCKWILVSMYELWILAASIGSISARCSSVSYGTPSNTPYGGQTAGKGID
ncbi:hypothetical protein V6N13_129081 [Hibiscus sabdariffa]